MPAERRAGRGPTRWLALLIGVHLALGLLYAWATPIFEAPDEGYHFAVTRWLALGNPLPVQQPGSAADWEQEGSQPPLYYWLASGIARWFDLGDWDEAVVRNPFVRHAPGTTHNANAYRRASSADLPPGGTAAAVQAVRWLSLALSAVTVWLTYEIARLAFPGRAWLALLAAAMAGLNPQTVFINASVNNDNLLMPISSGALLLMMHLMQPGTRHTSVKAAGLGVLLGLAALTKISGLVLWPIAGLALLIGHLRRSQPPSANLLRSSQLPFTIYQLLVAFSIAVLIAGWWYWRNDQLYGEWLGLDTMVAIAGARQPSIGLVELVRQEWQGFFWSFWGVFGVFTILPPAWARLLFGALTLLAAAGAGLALRRRARPSAEVVLLALFCALTLAGVVRWTLQTPASQGRLMFGAIAPLSVFLAAGLLAALQPLLARRLGPAWPRSTVLALAGPLFVVAAAIPLVVIAPRYAPPPRLAETGLPDDLRPVRVAYGDAIELIGYTAPDAPVRPGQPLAVTLYWRAIAPVADDFVLALHLTGRELQPVSHLDTWPGGGLLPTSAMETGVVYADTYLLPIDPAASAPAKLRLDVHFWVGAPENQLMIRALEGQTPRSVVLDVGAIVPPEAVAYAPQRLDGSRLAHGIELFGYDVGVDGALSVTLYWKLDPGGVVPGDYTVIRHLVNQQGVGLLIGDSPPLDGDWPTSAWLPGHTVADERLLALPPEIPPGSYNLRVGLYDLETGVRLEAVRPDGTRWPDDLIVLPAFDAP